MLVCVYASVCLRVSADIAPAWRWCRACLFDMHATSPMTASALEVASRRGAWALENEEFMTSSCAVVRVHRCRSPRLLCQGPGAHPPTRMCACERTHCVGPHIWCAECNYPRMYVRLSLSIHIYIYIYIYVSKWACLHVSMSACMFAYMHAQMYACTYLCLHVCRFECCMCACVQVNMHASFSVCTCGCTYISMRVYTYVYVYTGAVYVYIYIYL